MAHVLQSATHKLSYHIVNEKHVGDTHTDSTDSFSSSVNVMQHRESSSSLHGTGCHVDDSSMSSVSNIQVRRGGASVCESYQRDVRPHMNTKSVQ